MENLEAKKLALIRIWQILKEHSDETHPLTQDQIGDRLEKDYGIVLERKAIGRNISLLKEAGIEIMSGREGSYLSDRDFEDSELRMLIDGVLSSRYIPVKYSKDLIDKICKLSNKYFRANVNHIHSVNDWNKTDNRDIFLNIELIDDAIEQGKQIQYDYNRYETDKMMHKTSEQVVSPYAMILKNQRYYLMLYNEQRHGVEYHRLDHITNVKILEKRDATPLKSIPGYETGIDYRELSTALPYMYTDQPETIEMLADTGAIDQIIDWFGKDIRVSKTIDPEKVKVLVKASPNAMVHWAMQYIGHVEIKAPESLRARIKETLENGLKKYQ